MTKPGAVLIGGTSSGVGKSVIVAGVCRWLRRQGVSVAPFKAQNMSLNAVVTTDLGEIGRAQAAQAAAAGIPTEVTLNPVLIKPTGQRTAQLVVMGHPHGDVGAADYQRRTGSLMPVILGALEELRSRFDVVVCEGAGGIAEINLRSGDLANLGLARAAGLPVVLVGDIDRGGVFASLFGSLALLSPEDQAMVQAMVINKFRGDLSLVHPGVAELESRTGRAVLGVLPWLPGTAVDAEDSLGLGEAAACGRSETAAVEGDERLSVAVVRLPRISNFTDCDPLVTEPGVEVAFTQSAADLRAVDLVVLPGTKATGSDLLWLRSQGLDEALMLRARRGDPVLGICGGYQMLGRTLVDDVESQTGELPALGLLPVDTVFGQDKVLARPSGVALAFGGVPVAGYEIHHGRVRRFGADPMFGPADEGCHSGEVYGTSWHGIFENDEFRRAFLGRVAAVRGRRWHPGARAFADVREARLNLLADLIGDHIDGQALLGVIHGSSRQPLPVVTTGLARRGPGGTA